MLGSKDICAEDTKLRTGARSTSSRCERDLLPGSSNVPVGLIDRVMAYRE